MLKDTSGVTLRKTFFLDILRGLAALYVLIGHARWLLWEGYSEGYKLHPQDYGLLDTLQVFCFNLFAFGHQAVMLFFVLSGFVIHYSSYNQSIKSGRFAVYPYLLKRIKRIYPPFLFALAVTYVLDRIGLNSGYTIYSGTTDFWLINKSIASDLSLQTLLGNLAMLQKLATPVWGSNGPLWSLMYEWWFYILYIPVFFMNKNHPARTAGVIGLMYLISIFIPVQSCPWVTVINYFFAWYFGVITADWYMGRFSGIQSKSLLIAYVISVLLIATYFKSISYMGDFYISFSFALLLYIALHFSIYLESFNVLHTLSDFSYTLYVVHIPILVFISGWLQQRYNGALPAHFGYVYAGIAVCLLVAWTAYFFVERPFVKRKAS